MWTNLLSGFHIDPRCWVSSIVICELGVCDLKLILWSTCKPFHIRLIEDDTALQTSIISVCAVHTIDVTPITIVYSTVNGRVVFIGTREISDLQVIRYVIDAPTWGKSVWCIGVAIRDFIRWWIEIRQRVCIGQIQVESWVCGVAWIRLLFKLISQPLRPEGIWGISTLSSAFCHIEKHIRRGLIHQGTMQSRWDVQESVIVNKSLDISWVQIQNTTNP